MTAPSIWMLLYRELRPATLIASGSSFSEATVKKGFRPGEVLQAATDRRQVLDRLGRHVGRRAHAARRDVGRCGDGHLIREVLEGQLEGQIALLTEGHRETLLGLGHEALESRRHRVRSAGAGVRDRPPAVVAADDRVDGAGGFVGGGDRHARQHAAVGVRHHSGQGAAGAALSEEGDSADGESRDQREGERHPSHHV